MANSLSHTAVLRKVVGQKSVKMRASTPKGTVCSFVVTLGFQGILENATVKTINRRFDEFTYLFNLLQFFDHQTPR